MPRTLSLLTLTFLSMACAAEDVPELEARPTGADSVAAALAAFDAAAFDSISWDNQAAAMDRGRVVFSFSCMKCHGVEGRGDGELVTEGGDYHPPDLTMEGWRFADDHEGLREQIFTGTAQGMPHWGLEGLKYRDIDAVATFLRSGLRN